MKRKTILSVLAVCILVPSLALAGISFEGTVVSKDSIAVMAPFGGVVSSVSVQAGDIVDTGDALADVMTAKVYATTAGEITGVFGQAGDYVDNVADRYGAVLYITPERRYTISADTSEGYDTSDNLYLHLGETVYLRSYASSNGNTGVGEITAIDGTSFTVETTQGDFWVGETISVYRDPEFEAITRIGRGDLSRAAEIAINGSGSIVAMYVQDGDTVERGQLLYETVSGELDALAADGSQIRFTAAGIVESVEVSAGVSVEKGALVATVCAADAMQARVEINEYDLAYIKVGDTVKLSFSYDDLGMNTITGTVEMISDISFSSDTSDVSYYVYVDFRPNEDIRLGMTVIMETMDAVPSESEAETDMAETMP
ncbi:MAG: HlyD family efflux transporter periplasmic adaptor subunit [Clostridiales bacterium]|nr:HlyD family efflux transporter periplasmic adaptor subunit [Clostridiales bacterium]